MNSQTERKRKEKNNIIVDNKGVSISGQDRFSFDASRSAECNQPGGQSKKSKTV